MDAVPGPPERAGGKFEPPAPGASEQIAAQIRRYLEQQHLLPGERIGTEQRLAQEFGVSRPTLREALRLLSASQLIRVGRGRAGGVFVARTPAEGMSRSLADSISLMLAAETVTLEELLDARLSLEVPIAGRAATNADAAVVAALDEAVAAQEGQRPGTTAFDAADVRFHHVLARACGNRVLLALTGWILEVLQPALCARIGAALEPGAVLDQHRAILRAVRRRQPAAAERAMRAHVEYLSAVLDATRRA